MGNGSSRPFSVVVIGDFGVSDSSSVPVENDPLLIMELNEW